MAVDCELAMTDSMSVHECAKQFVGKLDLESRQESWPLRLYNDGVTATVLAGDENPFGRKPALQAFAATPASPRSSNVLLRRNGSL